MLTIVQTVGVVVAALASAYAVTSSEVSRHRDAKRARVERVLESVLSLAEVAVRIEQGAHGEAAALEVGRRRLRASLLLVGIEGFGSTELMTRPTWTAAEIAAQSEAAIIELSKRLDELAPRPLLRELLDH